MRNRKPDLNMYLLQWFKDLIIFLGKIIFDTKTVCTNSDEYCISSFTLSFYPSLISICWFPSFTPRCNFYRAVFESSIFSFFFNDFIFPFLICNCLLNFLLNSCNEVLIQWILLISKWKIMTWIFPLLAMNKSLRRKNYLILRS